MMTKTIPSRLGLITRALRTASYVAVVAGCSCGLGVRAVQAKSAHAAMAIGESLEKLEASQRGTLEVNGQRLHLATAHVDAPVHDVLDRLQQACESDADGLPEDLSALEHLMRSRGGKDAGGAGFPGVGLLRDERDDRGVVVCFAVGQAVDMQGLVRRIRTFLETHDAKDIGGMRYIAARADRAGGTRVMATWTDEHLALDAMFPVEGDSAGADPSLAPRPHGGRRLLSARVDASSYGAFVYGVTPRADVALMLYDAEMKARRFEVVEVADGSAVSRIRAYRQGLVDVLVTATDTGRGTTLSIIESHYATVANVEQVAP